MGVSCCLVSVCVQETEMYGHVYEMNQPVGVIGVACPDSFPLLAFVSLMAAALCRGNVVVIIPSEKHPLPAAWLYQVPERICCAPMSDLFHFLSTNSLLSDTLSFFAFVHFRDCDREYYCLFILCRGDQCWPS